MVGVVGRVGIVDLKGSRKDIAYGVWKNIIYRCYDSIEHASKAYFIAKARNIEDIANRSFACGRINSLCYQGLLRIANEMKGDL